MCIVQGDVETVANTQILVSPLAAGQQLTVYANQVSLGEESGAMILPVPEGKVEPLDLSEQTGLFTELEELWPKMRSLNIMSRDLNENSNSLDDTLEVFEVGSYQVSIIPTIEDFNRIDKSVFELHDDVQGCLREHYETRFSFVLCQLVKEKAYHPFGYIHSRLDDNTLFIPTRHFHKHKK